MKKISTLCLLVATIGLLACLCAIDAQTIPGYKTFWFPQTLDHFNPETQPQTFQQRYLINDTWYNPIDGPIFFYTGNEGDIEEFWNNTGLPFDLAPSFQALIVFAEHRYYGQSLPFGQDSFNPEHIGYLSVEQALADYATLIPAIKNSINAPEDAIVISFGGSYGGMLTAYFRTLYPNVVDMGLAASAPFMLLNPTFTQTPGFYEAVTNDFAAADSRCPDLYRTAFAEVLAIKQAGGYDQLTKYFSLCNPLTEDQWDLFFMWMITSFGNMAMCDYPYASDFLAPLPAWPITYTCELMINATTFGSGPLQGLIESISLFYNGTDGTLSCFNITEEYLPCSDQSGCGTGNDGLSWDYQACAEIIYFPNTNNVTDMFPARDWTLGNLTEHCQERWAITPRPGWVNTFVGLPQITQASRIIFSNGLLDPWHGGGVLSNLSDSLVSVIIAEGAHHLDLRASNPQDPISVIEARLTEANYFIQWIEEINQERRAKKENRK